MPISVVCQNCGKALKVKDEWRGKRAKCPGCGEMFVVGGPSVGGTAVAMPAAGVPGGGTVFNPNAAAAAKAQREKAVQRVKDAMAEIDAMGVQVKDLDIGLLDFPCEVDGQIVLLCWKLGEQSITHWHGVSEGFAGRKPVDDRITKAKRAN